RPLEGGYCKVCVLSVSNFCVCLPCVVTCLFLCLVPLLPCFCHVLSCVCLCHVVRVSTPHLFPIITRFVCLIGFSCVLLIPLVVCPALIVLTCPSLSVACVYI